MTDPHDNSKPNADSHLPGVLLVEDDPDQQSLICEALRMHFADADPASIVAVGTGADCLRQDLRSFDIVLLDYNLPDTTGLDLLGKILTRCDLPVIFVTGEGVAATAAEAIRRGAQDYIVKAGDYLFALPVIIEKNIRLHQIKQENTHLQAKLKASLEEIQVKNLQLEESLEKLELMAATDPLTHLANRRVFARTLERYFAEAARYGFDLSCAMCDLDHYKDLNDTLGHQAGDRILAAAAEAARRSVRATDTAARYGGDEFVLLLPHTSTDTAIQAATRIREQVKDATRRYTPMGAGVTVSIGIASLHSDRPASADALVAMADRALYFAKDQGKDRIVTYAECRAALEAGSARPPVPVASEPSRS